jgi:nucleotide-binding universal stress UspA family protein
VAVPRTTEPDERTFWMPREEQAIEAGREAAHRYLESIATRLRAAGRLVEPCIVLHHDPARAILRESAARGVDLVALATHGRGGLARVRLGSVADKVVRAAPCPTLVARPRGDGADGAPGAAR